MTNTDKNPGRDRESGLAARMQPGYSSSSFSDDWSDEERAMDEPVDDADDSQPHPIRRDAPKGYRARVPRAIRGAEVRKVRRRSFDGYTSDVPMTSLNYKIVSAESLIERDFLIVTDAFDDHLADVTAQPVTFDMCAFGLRAWTPDFRVDRTDGSSELVEIKLLTEARPRPTSDAPEAIAKAKAKAEEFARKDSAWREVATAHGYKYRLVTEDEIRIQPLLANALLMHRHLGPFLDRGLLLRAILALPSLNSDARISDLAVAIDNHGRAIETAIRLHRLGHIRLDRRVQFSLATAFTVVREGA